MYVRKHWIVPIAALALTLGLAACDDESADRVRGSGNVVTEEMTLAGFTGVDVDDAFVVEIAQSDSFSVAVWVDDDVLGLLNVSKRGDTLRIRLERGVRVEDDVTLEATVTMPALHGLAASSASQVSVSGFQSSDDLSIDLSGASALSGDLEAGDTDVELSGASRVELEGSATGLTVVASGASSLDLAEFEADAADVTLSGASEATLNVRERIDSADVSGASRLRFRGDPSLGDISTSDASTVDRIED